MDLFDNVRQKFRNTALTALKASSDLIEITKINLEIGSEETRIKSLMLDIGRAVYEKYKEGQTIEAELASLCEDIIEAEQNIEDMKQKIMQIKSVKPCKACGAEINQNDSYCPNCGSKDEEMHKAEETPEANCESDSEEYKKEE